MTQSDGRIPVLLVSGFLGSGKTTLIRHLLNDSRLQQTALIVNEFGEVGIDHHLMRQTDERTTLLRDGCVCCSLRDDLVDAMRDLLDTRDRSEFVSFDRLLIETTGLADPGPILHTITSDPVLRNRYRLDRVLITLDAASGLSNLEHYGEAVRQVAAADIVALTKLDLAGLAGLETIEQLRGKIKALNPIATVVEAPFGRIDADVALAHSPLLTANLVGHRTDPVAPAAMHNQADAVHTYTLTFDAPLDWRMFGVWLTLLLHQHGGRVLRMKGLLNVGNERGPLLLEGVQHVMHAPRHLAAWPDDDRRSRLVFIVRGIERAAVYDSLLAFQEAAASGA